MGRIRHYNSWTNPQSYFPINVTPHGSTFVIYEYTAQEVYTDGGFISDYNR